MAVDAALAHRLSAGLYRVRLVLPAHLVGAARRTRSARLLGIRRITRGGGGHCDLRVGAVVGPGPRPLPGSPVAIYQLSGTVAGGAALLNFGTVFWALPFLCWCADGLRRAAANADRVAWLPTIRHSRASGNPPSLLFRSLLAAAAVGLITLSGHPQLVALVCVGAGAYAIVTTAAVQWSVVSGQRSAATSHEPRVAVWRIWIAPVALLAAGLTAPAAGGYPHCAHARGGRPLPAWAGAGGRGGGRSAPPRHGRWPPGWCCRGWRCCRCSRRRGLPMSASCRWCSPAMRCGAGERAIFLAGRSCCWYSAVLASSWPAVDFITALPAAAQGARLCALPRPDALAHSLGVRRCAARCGRLRCVACVREGSTGGFLPRPRLVVAAGTAGSGP